MIYAPISGWLGSPGLRSSDDIDGSTPVGRFIIDKKRPRPTEGIAPLELDDACSLESVDFYTKMTNISEN